MDLAWLSSHLFTGDADLARAVLQRGIAAVYAIAFLAAWRQFPPLLGSRGLLPAPEFLQRVGPRLAPSLFHRRYSDRLLRIVAGTGMVGALATVAGLPQRGPWWVPLLVFACLYGLYLSIVNAGQIFYGFGWESLLLEAGFLAAFLGSDQTGTPVLTLIAFRWLVFRVEFGAGMIKWRGDRVWRDLTALDYHHETQPMPGPLSWFFHHLPKPLHRVEVIANHVVQLGVPWLLFAPQPVATWAAAAVIVTQLWLVASGNFAWLNWLTMLLAFAAVGDSALPWTTDSRVPVVPDAPVFLFATIALAVFVLALSFRPAANLLSRQQRMNVSFNRWHLVGAYGAFGSITRRRREVVVEATADPDPASATWHEYGFRGKPGDPRRLPRQFAPYHLRLDWGMWFLALGSSAQLRWFSPFLRRLLAADPAILRLLAHDPMDGARPAWVRARLFDYRYSTWSELRSGRGWWVRREVGVLVDPIER